MPSYKNYCFWRNFGSTGDLPPDGLTDPPAGRNSANRPMNGSILKKTTHKWAKMLEGFQEEMEAAALPVVCPARMHVNIWNHSSLRMMARSQTD